MTKGSKTLWELFSEIEAKSEFIFFYNDDAVDLSRRVEVDGRKYTIREILDRALEGSAAKYAIMDRQVIFYKSRTIEKVAEAEEALRQDPKQTVRGKVSDIHGEPVTGANVMERGTTNGVVTGMDGTFTLSVSDHAVLQVSYIGFLTQDIPVGDRTELYVELVEDTQLIDEVVVIGYGTVRKSDMTGAVASVSGRQFKDQPITQVSHILQGRAAGVDVTTTNGTIGAIPKIRVRGITSINKNNDPLWVVDGIIGGSIVNPSDIMSMEVLKDASSTAIYGSRGANGVILVTTKRGQEGKAQISLETGFGASTRTQKMDLLKPYEYALAVNEVLGAGIPADDLAAYQHGTKGIDWQDIISQTGFNQDYKLTVSGGAGPSRYLLSGNVLDQTSITISSKYKRYNFRVNLDSDVTPWLNVVTALHATHATSHNTGNANAFSDVINFSPTMEMVNEKGEYNLDPFNSTHNNPYGGLVASDSDQKAYSLNGYVDWRFQIAKDLTLSVLGGVNYANSTAYSFNSSRVYPMALSGMGQTAVREISWQNTNNLTYRKKWGDHSLTATAVLESSKLETENISISGKNLQNENVGYWAIDNAANQTATNGYGAEQMLSVFGRLMYGYKSRYLLSATLRADGSSKFQKNKWGYFPSAAAAWNVAEEDFMKDQNLFRQLKLRTSFGITGNQAIGRYETLGSLKREEYVYATVNTLYPGYWAYLSAAPNLSWEKTYQYDAGVDFSIWEQRLSGSIDWYRKDTKDLLFRKSIPMYDGGGSTWVNQGEVENTGWEFTLHACPLNSKAVVWESTLSAAYVRNTIQDLAGEEEIIPDRAGSGTYWNTSILRPGKPVGAFYLFDWAGIDEQGNNLYKTANGTSIDPQESDRILIGNPTPEWTFGWNNSLTWKNWELNLFLRASTGFNRLNISRFTMACMTGEARFITLRDAYYKNWDYVADKKDARFPSLTNGTNKVYGTSTQWLEDAGFLRIQNLSIGYLLPKSVTGIASVRLSASLQNLWTLTGYSGYDPETASQSSDSQGSDSIQGIDYGAYPLPRTFTFGLKLDF
ncbi:MAG: TonB-dependent receptor [Tannerella sp.]|nr:TonB-dependent receptor [Tannerella sp.]